MGSRDFSNWDNGTTFKVPAGVRILDITLRGAASSGVSGGLVSGRLRVDGGDVLWIKCGQGGKLPSGTSGGGTSEGGGGAGGNGHGTGTGGYGGGGATVIRLRRARGRIMAVAGGAGGASGDGGAPGAGGASIGAPGTPGTSGTGLTASATGGTQNQGGKGGTSTLGNAYSGGAATDTEPGYAGTGGSVASGDTNGGGGGGGGYHGGGGGCAGAVGIAPAGGGAGGANFAGGLYNVTSIRDSGFSGHGHVTITWEDPGGNTPPVPPQNITLAGMPIQDELATKKTDAVWLRGTPDDPDSEQGVRMLARLSRNPEFSSYRTFRGTYDATERRDKVLLSNLQRNTLYHLRIYTQDNKGKISLNYVSTSFWTNRPPDPPELLEPGDNTQFTPLVNVTFSWNPSDPDGTDPQTAFRLRYRVASTPAVPAGDWVYVPDQITSQTSWVIAAGTFKGHTFYEWQVATRDGQGDWSDFSESESFYVSADSQPPLLVSPLGNSAIPSSGNNDFWWKYRSPTQVPQVKADLRYRPAISAPDGLWTTVFGDTTTPGAVQRFTLPGTDFEPGTQYEWQVRTYSTPATPSDWSGSGYFFAVAPPGSGAGLELVGSGEPQAPLGQGNNRVFVYERGGLRRLGEITNMSKVHWDRKRDDISGVTFTVEEWNNDSKAFLANLRTWMHEVVVFRDDGQEIKRVWEGPITRIASSRSKFQVDAKDVLAYPYRRIMRQGYNDAYRLINGIQVGQHTVVERAAQIIMNALAYDDPNVLAYLTPLNDSFDARLSRAVKDFSKTSWEEIDDLAAHAGLDYTAAGRRIALWDTHRPIGRLPEMRDGDFSEEPIITEYGMSAANVFAVTNNNGVYGVAEKGLEAGIPPQGFIEQLASAYGSDDENAPSDELNRAAAEALRGTLTEQARRNIANRWTPPVVVRIPDNATLSPDLNIGINQFIPGVWIPLRSTGGVREVSQWQKLDSISVDQDGSGERISVVLSPAPNGGEDPDADDAAAEEA